MTYDERWGTCGIRDLKNWTALVRDGFTFVRAGSDTEDLALPGCKTVTLAVVAPWGETRNVRLDGVEPHTVVIIDTIIDASLRKAAAGGAQ
jgi:hypothetical protein